MSTFWLSYEQQQRSRRKALRPHASEPPDDMPARKRARRRPSKEFRLRRQKGKFIALRRDPDSGRRTVLSLNLPALPECEPQARAVLTEINRRLDQRRKGLAERLSGSPLSRPIARAIYRALRRYPRPRSEMPRTPEPAPEPTESAPTS